MTFERALRLVILPAIITIGLWVLVFDVADREQPGSDVTARQIRTEASLLTVFVVIWLLVVGAWAARRGGERRGEYRDSMDVERLLRLFILPTAMLLLMLVFVAQVSLRTLTERQAIIEGFVFMMLTVVWMVMVLVQVGAGAYWRSKARRDTSICNCGYSLVGLKWDGVCPECGRAIK